MGINNTYTLGTRDAADAIASKFQETTGRTLSATELDELKEWLNVRPWYLEFDNCCTVTIEEGGCE